MYWMIEGASDAREFEALIKAKEALLGDMADLNIIKEMTKEDFAKLDIPAGLGKHLVREVKRLINK